MSWSYQWYVEPIPGEERLRIASGLEEEDQSRDVPVTTLNGSRRIVPELWRCSKEIFDRLWKCREDPRMQLRFYRQRPNGAIREVRPRRRAGADLASRARALAKRKRQKRTPF